ncbi:MAG: aldose epimerase family protein [Paracoccaceae bacterium]
MTRISSHVLQDGDVTVTMLNLGCITQDWRVPVGNQRVPVVLGYRDPQAYLRNPNYLGVIAGRVANRIGDAAFTLNRQRYTLDRNDGAHHLHGGARGLQTRLWEMEPDGQGSIHFRLISERGDQGYPGQVEFTVLVTLRGHDLTYDMRAIPDRDTPINLAQHSYYNLMGQGDIWDHELMIAATGYTPTDADLIPTGHIVALEQSALDVRIKRRLSLVDPAKAGIDLNYVLDPDAAVSAYVTAPNGLELTLVTDQPGLQFYSGSGLTPLSDPWPGQMHDPFSGLCLESQGFPNSPNFTHFPSVIATPDQLYHQRTTVRIAPAGAS